MRKKCIICSDGSRATGASHWAEIGLHQCIVEPAGILPCTHVQTLVPESAMAALNSACFGEIGLLVRV